MSTQFDKSFTTTLSTQFDKCFTTTLSTQLVDAQHPTPLQNFPFSDLYRHRVVTDENSHPSKCINIEYSKEFEKMYHIEWILLNVEIEHIPDWVLNEYSEFTDIVYSM